MSRLNAAWHARHVMPKNPTEEQRIAWHVEHAKHCACRPIPPKLAAAMKARGLSVDMPPPAPDAPAKRARRRIR
jgi:hypothetical protein